jgi:hypothetical protein
VTLKGGKTKLTVEEYKARLEGERALAPAAP